MHSHVNTLSLLLLAWVLVACSLTGGAEIQAGEGRSVETVANAEDNDEDGGQAPPLSRNVENIDRDGGGAPRSSIGSPAPLTAYFGETSLEERIINYPVVVRAVLDSAISEVIEVSGYDDGKYAVAVKLHLTVREYLNGSGSDSITGVWPSAEHYDSRTEAEADRLSVTAQRSTPYDDREAIFFLTNDFWVYGAARADDTYYLQNTLGFAGSSGNDTIDVRNLWIRLWLPSSGSNAGIGDSREYLLALPGFNLAGFDQTTVSSTSTITLAALKARIEAVNAELNKPGGSAADRRECLKSKYNAERIGDYSRLLTGEEPIAKAEYTHHSVESGAPAGTILFEDRFIDDFSGHATSTTWLEGEDAALFEIVDDPASTPEGVYDSGDYKTYSQWFKTLRPLPSGIYNVTVKHESKSPITGLCFGVKSFDWTVTSTPWTGVSTHEFFFDPVADTSTSAVGADGTSGVLKPASFADSGGATTTISRLEWATSTVTLTVSPTSALADLALDFIETDGTVSLSLAVADATVDTANDTLSWSVISQPWHAGDELMVRARRQYPPVP